MARGHVPRPYTCRFSAHSGLRCRRYGRRSRHRSGGFCARRPGCCVARSDDQGWIRGVRRDCSARSRENTLESRFADCSGDSVCGAHGRTDHRGKHQAPAGRDGSDTGATGAVGRFGLFSARRLGARVVAAVRASHAAEARALGAAQVIVLGEEDWTGAPFDHVFDTVGGPAIASLCRHLVPGGLIRTASTTPINPEGLPSKPVFVPVHQDGRRLRELALDVAAGRIPIPMAGRMPLEQAVRAHHLVEAGGLGGKIILDPS